MTERTVAKQTRLEDDAISITSTQSDHYGSTEEFEVEAVLAEKTKNGKKLYLLSWAGYPEEKSTWEPEKNISKEILQQWKQKKKRQAQNLEEPFSVAQFEAKLKRLAAAKEERHKRRKAKKRRLGMPVSESESDVQQVANDSDSSSEAVEDNPTEDVPVAKAERKTKSPTKKKPFKVLVTGSAIQKPGESSDEDARAPTRRNSRQENSAKSSVEPVKPPQSQVPEPGKPKQTRKLSDSSSDVPPSQSQQEPQPWKPRKPSLASMTSDSPIPQSQIPNSRLGSVASDAAISQKGSRPGSSSSDAPSAQHLQRSRPGSSSSEGPLTQQRPGSTTLPQAASITTKSTTKLKPKVDSLGLGRGRPSVRASSSIGIAKSATRGGSSLGPKNVFAAREPPKQRPNLLQNAANSSKDPKTFANMHLRRKAELQAREKADAAPDISALPGGLFDPSNPSAFKPIRPSTLRKTSSTIIDRPESVAHQTSDDDDPWKTSNQDNRTTDSPQAAAASTPSDSRIEATITPETVRATCYYFDLYERNGKGGSCNRGDSCKYLHAYEAGVPVAPRPPNLKYDPPMETISETTSRPPWVQDSVVSEFSSTRPPWRKDSITEADTLRDSTNTTPWEKRSSSIDAGIDSLQGPSNRIQQERLVRGDTLMASPMEQPGRSQQKEPAFADNPMRSPPGLFVTLVPTPVLTPVQNRLESAPSTTAQSLDPPPRPQWNPRDPLNAICYFWAMQGSCTKNRTCRYLHEDDPNIAIAPSPAAQRKAPCRFWLQGTCRDAGCRFSHDPESASSNPNVATTANSQPLGPSTKISSTPTRPPTGPRIKSVTFADAEPSKFGGDIEAIRREAGNPKSELCHFWRTGHCRYGEKCRNRHGYESEDDTSNTNMDFEMQKHLRTRATEPSLDIGSHTADAQSDHSAPSSELQSRSPVKDSNSANPEVSKQTEVFRVESLPTLASTLDPVPAPPAIPKPQRAKMNLDNNRRNMAMKLLGNRAKEVIFGSHEQQSFLFDFGDLDQALQYLWAPSFASLLTVPFNQMIMAQDFEIQSPFLRCQALWQGSLAPADPVDSEAVKVIDKVADELVLRSAGLISSFEEYSILTFPSKKDEWRFLEQTFGTPQEARLRYFVFSCALDINKTLETKPLARLPSQIPYRTTITNKIHRLQFQRLLPVYKKGENPYNFYLLFPTTANYTERFLTSWVRASHPECKIYSSHTAGSWEFFASQVELGVVLIHESVAADIDRIPFLFQIVNQDKKPRKTFAFWYISDSTSPYPLFPSTNYASNNGSMGSITTTRLFPHGCAFLLTPSFLVSEPGYFSHLLDWFLMREKGKFYNSTKGTWKIVCCHGLPQYLLDLANSKASENKDFENENRDKPNKDALLEEKGLDWTRCKLRYKLHKLLVDLESRLVLDSSSDDFDSDRGDDIESPIVPAPRSIDPDDEQALVNWFAGWSMQKLDTFKKFVVVGTDSKDPRIFSRASRIKEIIKPREIITTSTFKSFPMSKNSFDDPFVESRDYFAVESPQALSWREIQAKHSASVSTKNQNPDRTPEGRGLGLDDMFASSPAMPHLEPARKPTITHHGIDRLPQDAKQFVAITGASAAEAESFLEKANYNLQIAVRMFKSQEQGSEPMDIDELIASSRPESRHRPAVVTADEDIARNLAFELSHSPSISNYSAGTKRKHPESSPQSDGANEGSMGFDGADERPVSSGTESSKTSRSGIVTGEDGTRFVPRSIRPDNSIRKEIPIKPGYIPTEDKEVWKSLSRRAAEEGSRPTSAGGERMDVDSGPETSRRMSAWREPPEIEKKTITFEPTMDWYERLQKQGGGWEHIFVGGWGEAFKVIGVGKQL